MIIVPGFLDAWREPIAYLGKRRWVPGLLQRLGAPSRRMLGTEVLRRRKLWKLHELAEGGATFGYCIGVRWVFESRDLLTAYRYYCLPESFEADVLVAAFRRG